MGSQSPRVWPPSRRICYSKRGKSFAIYGLALRSLSWNQTYEEFLFYRPPFFFRLELYYKTRICGQSRKGNSYSRQWIRVLTCLVKLAFWAGIQNLNQSRLVYTLFLALYGLFGVGFSTLVWNELLTSFNSPVSGLIQIASVQRTSNSFQALLTSRLDSLENASVPDGASRSRRDWCSCLFS